MRLHFIVKPKEAMGSYRAVNWLSEKDDDSWGLKTGQIFVREDWWKDKVKRLRIEVHEISEIWLMRRWGMSYEEAHKLATKVEQAFMRDKHIRWKE